MQVGDNEQARDRYRQFRAIRDHANPPHGGGRTWWSALLPSAKWTSFVRCHPLRAIWAEAPPPAAAGVNVVTATLAPGPTLPAQLEDSEDEPSSVTAHSAGDRTWASVNRLHQAGSMAGSSLVQPVLHSAPFAESEEECTAVRDGAGPITPRPSRAVELMLREGTIVRTLSKGPGGEEFDAAAAKVAAAMGNPLWQVVTCKQHVNS